MAALRYSPIIVELCQIMSLVPSYIVSSITETPPSTVVVIRLLDNKYEDLGYSSVSMLFDKDDRDLEIFHREPNAPSLIPLPPLMDEVLLKFKNHGRCSDVFSLDRLKRVNLKPKD